MLRGIVTAQSFPRRNRLQDLHRLDTPGDAPITYVLLRLCFALLCLCFAFALPCFALLCLCFSFASPYLVFFYITSQQTPQFSSPSGNTIINHFIPFELPLPHPPCTYPSSPLAFVSIRDITRSNNFCTPSF